MASVHRQHETAGTIHASVVTDVPLAPQRVPAKGVAVQPPHEFALLDTHQHRAAQHQLAPQFHENHVLNETFAFNLLMGRRWPARAEDLEECEAVCRDLGLGELIDRMPAGLNQMVGETGWQLSHGERSRLYIARALLQRADLVLLDESFAVLDP